MTLSIDKMVENVVKEALDEYIYKDKTLREWIRIIAELELCEDAISRQAVIDTIDKWIKDKHILVTLPTDKITPLFEGVHDLSPVNPKPICEEREKGECPYYAR